MDTLDPKSNEVWKCLEEFPNYQISSFGRVKNIERGNILIGSISNNGYQFVSIPNIDQKLKRKNLSRLVAETFLRKEDNMTVDHIDRNKTNNKLINLRWATESQQKCNRTVNPKIGRPIYQCDKNKKPLKKFISAAEAAREFNMGVTCFAGAAKKEKMSQGYYWIYCDQIDEQPSDEDFKKLEFNGYEPIWVSSHGYVKKEGCPAWKGSLTGGYMSVSIRHIQTKEYKSFRVHRLVAMAFIGIDDRLVNHKNSITTDNRISNLEYATKTENIQHAYDNNRVVVINKFRIIVLQSDKNCGIPIMKYHSIVEASEAMDVTEGHMGNVCRGIGKTCKNFTWMKLDTEDKLLKYENVPWFK